MDEAQKVISPQPGPQTLFASTRADIAIYGGAAGSGKSFALLLEPLRNLNNPLFKTVCFRRTGVQVRNAGGLWDDSFALYSQLNAKPREALLEWEFESGATLKFSHLENEKDIYSWQGSQISLIEFDEVTHFTEKQFWYLFSRLRSMSGVPGYVRATCNPDPDSFIRSLIDWYIDGDTGFAIPERSGIVRWFVRQNGTIIWSDTKEELIEVYGSDQIPKSFTFIAAKIYDNQILLKNDPGYLSNLHALSRVDRMRLLEGNWNVRESAGMMFRREWFPLVDSVPPGWHNAIRFWDRAATKPSETNRDPDYTRGLLVYHYPDDTYCIVDLKTTRDTPGQVESLIKAVAQHDGYSVSIMCQQDPGSAGVGEAEHFMKMLGGYDVCTDSFSKDKVTRAKPVSAQAEAGFIKVLRSTWNDEFFKELDNFPDALHDDIVDCLSGAFNKLTLSGISTLDAYRRH